MVPRFPAASGAPGDLPRCRLILVRRSGWGEIRFPRVILQSQETCYLRTGRSGEEDNVAPVTRVRVLSFFSSSFWWKDCVSLLRIYTYLAVLVSAA